MADTDSTTGVGSVFVSNYPPYSAWGGGQVEDAFAALDRPAESDVPLGLYLHIPFCRKRCKFCYFKVYTEKDSRQVRRYLSGLASEVELLAERPVTGLEHELGGPSVGASRRQPDAGAVGGGDRRRPVVEELE